MQTWHAPFSPKCVEKDAEQQLGIEYTSQAKYDGQITNAILVNSRLQEEQFIRAFWLNKDVEFLRYGLPRNDSLIKKQKDLSLIFEIKKDLQIDADDYVVLYAPTFRDDYSITGYQIDFEAVRRAFIKVMNKECTIIIRLHPNVVFQKNKISFSNKIIDGTSCSDIQELAIACDAVISDYSTSIFDFAMLKKPAFICALDLDEYEKKRGLLKEFYDFPFPIAKTNAELIKCINEYDTTTYYARVTEYFRKYPFYDNGNAAYKTARWIAGKMSLQI